MAELATIARPYAEALYKASQADLPATAGWLDEIALIAADPKLLQYAEDPKVSDSEIFDLIVGVAKSALGDHAKNFLRTVIDNRRLAVLPEIAVLFRVLKNAQGGLSDAVVFSAFPIEGESLAEVAAVLEKRFGRRLQFSVALEPALIGGIRVVVGDEVLDTSVKARLEQMKLALAA